MRLPAAGGGAVKTARGVDNQISLGVRSVGIRPAIYMELPIAAEPMSGTIFKWIPPATRLCLQFHGRPDGSYPEGNLIIDSSGRLYGTAASGGQAHGCFTTGGTGCGVSSAKLLRCC